MEIEAIRRVAHRIVEVRGRDFRLSSEDRKDLLQEVLIRYVHAWSGEAQPNNVEAWLETTTARVITDRWRAEQRRPAVAEVEDHEGDPYDVVADFMEVARSRQPSMPAVGDAVINQVFGLVPPADADLLQRRLVDDVEPSDLADELGISRAAVDQRISRAKARLRAALAAQPELLAELQAGHPHAYDRGRQ
ncbi:RNA polymerase sigma factor [Nocardioides zhouii]|uniref:RNA polymerase sigma factor n=1 Tax=Nocardioides zhouii TaxID=1168729 RepID=UPI0013EAD47A|nr:sigma-70 family RNA polymerase sigma factor [Nocardioides zhouii]